MGEILLVNWGKSSDGLYGGVESVNSDLAKILGAKEISLKDAMEGTMAKLRPDYYHNKNIDNSIILAKYLKKYEDLFDVDLIISSDDCAGFFEYEGVKAPYYTVFQNPYRNIGEALHKDGFYNFEEYLEFGVNYPMLQNLGAFFSKRNIAVSNFMSKYLDGFKMKVINHGVDLDLFKYKNVLDMRRKYGIPLDRKVGLFVGSFHPVSGYATAAKLAREMKDIFWIFVLKHEIKTKVRLPNVKLFGPQARSTLPEFYSMADFVFSASPCEGFNLRIIEAGACNTPVVTTATGVAYDWWDDRLGYRITDRNNIEGIKSAINDVFKHDFEPRQAIVDGNFSFEKWSKDWLELLNTTRL